MDRTSRRRRIIMCACVALLSVGNASLSHAQFGGIVYDPRNHLENRLTALRTYTQILQQADQLRNEAQMLINDARNLRNLDFDTSTELLGILNEIAHLNSQAQNVAYETEQTRVLVQEHYPETYEQYSHEEFAVRTETQWQMSRSAFNQSMVMQSKLVESISKDRDLLGQLMSKSQSAAGGLQATQSTNQLLALLIKLSLQAQQMQITQSRAESIEQARRIAIEKESREQLKTFLGSDTAYTGGHP